MKNLTATRKNNRYFISVGISRYNRSARPSKKVIEKAKKMIVAACNDCLKHEYYICIEHISANTWYPNCQNQDINFDLVENIID